MALRRKMLTKFKKRIENFSNIIAKCISEKEKGHFENNVMIFFFTFKSITFDIKQNNKIFNRNNIQ